MRIATIFFALGIWLLQQQAELPNFYWAWLPIFLIPALLLPRHALWQRIFNQTLLAFITCSLGFFYAAWFAQLRLADSLPDDWQGKDIDVVGVVAEMPKQHERGLHFVFDVEQVLTPNASVPPHILLATYDGGKEEGLGIHAGERWQFTVRLKHPHGSVNPHGFDFEAWMLEHKLRAKGYVRPTGYSERLDELVNSPGYLIEHMRETVRNAFQNSLGSAPYAGVLIALAIGDQGSIPASQWQVFTRTGVNHLMSISGLHITMLAGMAFAVVYGLWRRSIWLTHQFPARKVAALIGLLVALGYALLAGFGIPAQRTVAMLATIAAALWMSRTIAPSQLLASALLVVLLFDPWAVLSPGFWLSFGAVALIFYTTAHRLRRANWLIEYGRVQWALSIGLIPPLLAMFQQVSLVSPVANAFAIPLISLLVVPLTLLGTLLPFDWILNLAHLLMTLCMAALQWLNGLPDAVWTQHAPPGWSIVLGMAGVLWVLLPRGFPARWLGLLLMLPMFLSLPSTPQHGALRLVIFDVGQGLAVVAQTQNHALLFDTGPDFGSEADSGNRILIPSLYAQGIAKLDGLMLSHDDNDHTGGARSILQTMPVGWVSSSLAADHELLQHSGNTRQCMDGQTWEWDGVRFEVLHPSPESYGEENISDNDRGCVLKISAGNNSVLLAADVEKDAERRLLQEHVGKLATTLVVVPHHGSKTSSTEQFVNSVHPRYAVFTVGFRNRFGHPKPEVTERYRAAGSELLRSDEDGAIIVDMDEHNFIVDRYRKTHARYWRKQQAVN